MTGDIVQELRRLADLEDDKAPTLRDVHVAPVMRRAAYELEALRVRVRRLEGMP